MAVPVGKLVAVGVVDILPRCLSSVYLFWDPDYRHLALGKLTALYELLWVQQVGTLGKTSVTFQGHISITEFACLTVSSSSMYKCDIMLAFGKCSRIVCT